MKREMKTRTWKCRERLIDEFTIHAICQKGQTQKKKYS